MPEQRKFSSWYRTSDGLSLINLEAADRIAVVHLNGSEGFKVVVFVGGNVETLFLAKDEDTAQRALTKLAAQLAAHFRLELRDTGEGS